MFYVRHDNRQAKFADKQKAWAYAQTLKCDLDIYDSTSRSVVFGTFRADTIILLAGHSEENDPFYFRTINAARADYRKFAPDALLSYILLRWDWDAHAWVTVYDSNAKAA